MQPEINPSKETPGNLKEDIYALDRLLEEVRAFSKTKARLYKVFRSIHKKMNEGIPYEVILDSIFNSLTHILPFDRIGITILEENDKLLRVDWTKSKSTAKWLKKDYKESLAGSVLVEVIERNTPVIVKNFEEYLLSHPNSEVVKLLIKEGMKSGLTYPLKVEGKPIGAITFTSTTSDNFQKSHIDLFSAISEGLAIIVEKEILKRIVTFSSLKENALKSSIHDLNNSLTVIRGTLDMIEKLSSYQTLKIETKNFLPIMRRNCEAMIKIVRSVTYGENEKVHSVDYLRNFITDMRQEAVILGRSKDITIELEIGPKVEPNMLVNDFVTKEALSNLISNAVKFSARGTKIIIRTDFDPSRDRLIFTVQDEGPGIPKEEQDNLFKQYGTTSVKSTAGELSSGHGLANVKKDIESLHGEVFIRSEVGQGSIFGFWIPPEHQHN